ncbi:MAG: histidine kinase dimerization/phospho-acceptor domain-containing protein, partial [Microcystaceae cyanobacterium]
MQELKQAQQTVIAQEKLASLGTLVAGMAHEIRNPVHLIQWNAQLTAQELQNLQQRWEENRVFLEDIVPELLE